MPGQVPTEAEWALPHIIDDAAVVTSTGREWSTLPIELDGSTLRTSHDDGFAGSEVLRVHVPASAFDDVASPLVASLDHHARLQTRFDWLGALGALLGIPALTLLWARIPFQRDERYLDVAPGVQGKRDAVAAAKSPTIPVRFEPPADDDLTRAGLVWQRGDAPEHLAAELVGMASRGEIELGLAKDSTHSPKVERRTPPSGRAQHVTRLWNALPQTGTLRPRVAQELTSIVKQARDSMREAVFLPFWSPLRVSVVVLLGIGLPAVAFLMFVNQWTPFDRFSPLGGFDHLWLSIGLWWGSWVALVVFFWRQYPALTAEGSVLRDQLEGFKRYLETAEQHQLQYEEGRDIFREYLPWAVLFGITERWTAAVRKLSRDGGVPAPDTSWLGSTSTIGLHSALSDFTKSTSRSSSTSSSGGSWSGFSSSSSGGGGGGGTGASSW